MGQLGYWNLYGRLLNEGPYLALEMKLSLLKPEPNSSLPWTTLHVRFEGSSVQNGDVNGGNLNQYRVSQLYVQAGNVLLKDVTFQVGTLDYYYGTLGLYDLRIAELLYETMGASGFYHHRNVDLLVALGDSGYSLYGTHYTPVITGAASLRVRLFDNHLELGLGGQFMDEPEVIGNQYAPYNTPLASGITYADYARQDIVTQTVNANPELANNFPKPVPTSGVAYKAIGYLGFGNLGALKWDSFFINFLRQPPVQSYTETYLGRQYTLYVAGLTNQRFQLNFGNELILSLIPNRLDLVWSFLYGYRWDNQNQVSVSTDDEQLYSTVLRLQAYLTNTVHFLLESSAAHERSLNGNAFRNHADSVFQSTNGRSDPRGLEFGDSPTRDTWQLKIGPVLNPLGPGIFTRPTLRLLYGLQYSTANAAYSNSFVANLDQNNVFQSLESHWHQVIALEAEAWF